MKKNNKGFTLVELLGVIVVLAIIIGIAVPVYGRIKDSIEAKNYRNNLELVKAAASKYYEDANIKIAYVKDLIEAGYLDEKTFSKLINPKNNESIQCYLVKINEEKGNSYADIIEKSYTLDGGCDPNAKYYLNDTLRIHAYSIISETELNKNNDYWTNEDVRLTYEIVNEGELNESQIVSRQWEADYEIITENDNYELRDNGKNLIIKKQKLLEKVYTLKITTIDGKKYDASYYVRIDKIPPKINDGTFYPSKNGWSNEKTYTINASDSHSGVYQYGTSTGECSIGTYSKNKRITFNKVQKINVCVKDKAGNTSDGLPIEVINIDNTPPTCTINVTGGSVLADGKIWYYEKPQIQVVVNDKYLDINGNLVDSSQSISIKYTQTNPKATTISKTIKSLTNTKPWETTLETGGNNTITVIPTDNTKNTNTAGCSTIVNLDDVQPNISAKNATNTLKYEENKSLIDLFNITTNYGPSGGTTTCYYNDKGTWTVATNNSSLGLGIHKIKCEMVGKNRKTSSATTIIKHSKTSTNFTCSEGWAKLDGTCKKTECELWNEASCAVPFNDEDGVTDATCSTYKSCCVDGNYKTCCVDGYKTCITSCTDFNNSNTSTTKTTSGCTANSGTLTYSYSSDRTSLNVVWKDFDMVWGGGVANGNTCYSPFGITIDNLSNSGLKCTGGLADYTHTGLTMGSIKSGQYHRLSTNKALCAECDTTKYSNCKPEPVGNICPSGKCGYVISTSIPQSQLTSGKNLWIFLGDGTQTIHAYHKLCNPTIKSDSICGCSKAEKKAASCGCAVAESRNAKCGCETFKCKTWNAATCAKSRTDSDDTKRSYSLPGTDYESGTAIAATCDHNGNCSF